MDESYRSTGEMENLRILSAFAFSIAGGHAVPVANRRNESKNRRMEDDGRIDWESTGLRIIFVLSSKRYSKNQQAEMNTPIKSMKD